MTVVDLLRDAKKRYAAAPSHARLGEKVAPGRVCVVMALNEASSSDSDAYYAAKHALRASVPTLALADWNAEHSTEEVLEAFDRAIAEAKA